MADEAELAELPLAGRWRRGACPCTRGLPVARIAGALLLLLLLIANGSRGLTIASASFAHGVVMI